MITDLVVVVVFVVVVAATAGFARLLSAVLDGGAR